MNAIRTMLVGISLFGLVPVAGAMDATDRYAIEQITQGGGVSLRNAAKNLQRAGGGSPVVLDTLAEAIYRNAATRDRHMMDGVAWACKAFSTIGDQRYSQTLLDAARNSSADRKVRKHCKVSYDRLGAPSGPQYQQGSANFSAPPPAAASAPPPAAAPAPGTPSWAQPAAPAPSAQSTPPPAQPSAPPANQYRPITDVAVGMSMQEAFAIAGPPTSTTSHATGKAFIPFNYGGDTARSVGLYKGQGRIVFSNPSRFSSGMQVVEVLVDPGESGYP